MNIDQIKRINGFNLAPSEKGLYCLYEDVVALDGAHKVREYKLQATIEKLNDALHEALPFVEDQADSQEFKRGYVEKIIAKIRAAIAEVQK